MVVIRASHAFATFASGGGLLSLQGSVLATAVSMRTAPGDSQEAQYASKRLKIHILIGRDVCRLLHKYFALRFLCNMWRPSVPFGTPNARWRQNLKRELGC